MSWNVPAGDGELMPTHTSGQDWLVSWHRPDDVPDGQPHGAAGICLAEDDQLVLISPDGVHWGFPAGRPEDGETIEETLRREMSEEACVDVVGARLLGYSRSLCLKGRQEGLALARSYWRADVVIRDWQPEHEITRRKVVPASQATGFVRDPDEVATRISFRALAEAGLA